jgi:lauroyl/myristoyl acyltransferase
MSAPSFFAAVSQSADTPSKHSARASADALRLRVTIENPELVTVCVDAKQSVILLTAHFGNWEWLSLATGAHFDITIDVVYQPQRVEAVDRFLREARARFGGRFIPRKDFIFDLLSRAGQPRVYALIADQTPKGKDPRQWTRFLEQDSFPRCWQDRAISRREGSLLAQARVAARLLRVPADAARRTAVPRGRG